MDWILLLLPLVALLGLKSLFGQASSLMLKQSPNIYSLRLYDETDISVVHDINIIRSSSCEVEAYQGRNNLNEAIKGSDIVLIGDDFLSTPQTCFDVMAPKMQDYAKAIAESSPNALIIVAASPINKLVPVLSELLLEIGYYDCNKVIGSTAVHSIRANCILSSYMHTNPQKVFLPVIGGDSEETIVPLFSQAKPHFNISEVVMRRLINEIKQAHSLIYELKGSSEALNKAYSTVKFLNSVMAGLKGEPNIMNIAFTRTTQVEGTEYCALPVLLGRFGVQARYGIPNILPFESDLLHEAIINLQKDTNYAKLFCKSRDTAVECCKRNIANKFKKSKEFEKFVNNIKTKKNGNKSEDKLINKIKAPILVESGQLPSKHGEKPFDTMAFCLKHKPKDSRKGTIIPPYMKTGGSIMQSLLYGFQKEENSGPNVPKSSLALTPICEPIVCPDQPKNKPINYSNIVSLVEKLVKQTTEKMLNEKEKDIVKNKNLEKEEKFSEDHQKSKKIISENCETLKVKPEKFSIANDCESKDKGHKIIEKKFSENYKNEISFINEHKTPLKRKHSETSIEALFRTPACNTFKQRNEFKLPWNQSDSSVPYKPIQNHIGINVKKESDNSKTYIAKFFHCPKTMSGSKTIKNDTNYFPIEKYPEFNSKTQTMPISSKAKTQEDDVNKSGRTMQLLNLFSYGKTKKSVGTKNNENYSENSCTTKSAFPESIATPRHYKTSKHNPLLEDNMSYSKKSNLEKESRKPPEEVIIEERLDSLENKFNENSSGSITKDHKKKYFSDKYKYQVTPYKIPNIQKAASPYGNICNHSNTKIGIKNSSLALYKNLPKKENSCIIYDTMRRKPSEFISNNNKFESFENKVHEKSKVKNNKSISKLLNTHNNLSKKENVLMRNDKVGKKTAESKENLTVTSTCYNTSDNEVKKVNEEHRSQPTSSVVTASQGTTLNNNKRVSASNISERNLISESACSKRDDFRPMENSNSTQTDINGKDLNTLLQMLDNEVFKCNGTLDTSKGEQEREILENQSSEKRISLLIGQKGNENITSTSLVKKEDIDTQSEIKEQSVIEDIEMISMQIDSSGQDKKSISQHSEKHNSSSGLSIIDNKENILPEVKELQTNEIQLQDKNAKPVLTVDSDTYNKEPISQTSEGHYSTPRRNIHQDLSSGMNETKEKQNYSDHFQQISRTDNIFHNRKYVNSSKHKRSSSKDMYSKPLLEVQTCHSVKNSKHINKVKPKSSFTISERSINKKNNSYTCNIKTVKPKSSEQVCANCKQALNNTKISSKIHTLKEGSKRATSHVNFKIQNSNFSEQSNQKIHNTKQNHKLSRSKLKVFVSSPTKSFIAEKLKAINKSKKENASEMFANLSGHIGRKVNEINKNEHSFRIKDKNGIKNFYLLRGLLPKVDDKKKSLNEKENLSLLKTKVCNDDPFMSINDKSTMKTKTSNKKLPQKKNKVKEVCNMREEINDPDSLMITHNSVYSPKCPVHGYKYFFNKDKFSKKSTSPRDNEIIQEKNSNVLSNLSRISRKISGTRNSSPNRLSQKPASFKPYSTSAQFRYKSPSRMLIDNKKTTSYHKLPKDSQHVTTTAQKPHGFIQKQRIAKILERSVKKITQHQKSNIDKNSKTQAEQCVVSRRQNQTCKLKELNKSQCKFLTEPIVPFHSEEPNGTVKIVEQFFNRGWNTSYVERSIKCPPNFTSGSFPWKSNTNKIKKSLNLPIRRMETPQSSSINWSSTYNSKSLKFYTPDSNENDILERGTCLDHVKNKYLTNNVTKFPNNYDAFNCKQSDSMNSSSISNAYTQYTKDFVKSEYSKRQKIPSIRQLHESAFR